MDINYGHSILSYSNANQSLQTYSLNGAMWLKVVLLLPYSHPATVYHIESPASISPSSMVASLLPVRTGQHNQGHLMDMETGNILMGSLGWKSTAVTVPLWPGSCDDHIHEYYSPRGNRSKTHLIQDVTTLHVPDTYHSVSSSDGCTTSIVILTPSSTQ